MKKILSTLALSSLVLLSAGCSDLLEEENHSNVMQDFMSTPSGFGMALNSVYANVRSTYSAEEGIHGLMNPGTDELKNNVGGSNRCADLANYDLEKYNANNEYPRKLWNDAYVHINTLNYMIENAGKVDVTTSALTAAQRDQYLGEAYFMRAYNYFHLVEQFGDVTLTTTYNAAPSTSAERHDMVRIYEEVIVPDLLNAVRLCSPSPQLNNLESGRASAAAARHLLSRVYLTLGWVFDKEPANPIYKGNTQTKYYNTAKAKEYYQKAYDMATGLISDAPSLGLKLMDNYADVFDEANDAPSGKNKEELFVARMDWDDDNTFGGRSTLNHYFVNGYDQYLGERNINDGRCYSWINPTGYTYNAFDNRDKDTRYEATFQTVWYATKTQKGGVVNYVIDGKDESFNWDYTVVGDTAMYYPGYYMSAEEIRAKTQHREGNHYLIFTPDAYNGRAIFPTIMKFLDRTRAIPNDNTDRSYIIYRLGETYLLAAEAAFKLGDNINAAKYINVVRERARNKQTTEAGALDIAPGDVTLDFILEERTRELLAEHCRWADLARTGTLIDRVRKYDDGKAYENITEDRHWLRPIPQQMIDRVTTGEPYPQNPNW
ncbi:RagB/SusD family nutrient uptake outer membrane protein [Bacteroides fluxus]|uniref:RagB/SusD family nutrient uptake outer membrane protein n=1 Tax=Bacteroides fluxus TaxID=626930 RepID=UPI0023A8AF87|nr:RagB/SusD family nutrient uptake outer membrane protein [Bacteroides fluxus]